MKVLVIGSGGREHALAWKLLQSPKVDKVFCAPGNAGIAMIADCVNIKANDIKGLLSLVEELEIDLTVVGPEEPLVKGIVDAFESKGYKVFGPNKKGALLEGSKVFAKRLMEEYGIPTAPFAVFRSYVKAGRYAERMKYPAVVKAGGLAAGKGVFVCKNRQEAFQALYQIMVEKNSVMQEEKWLSRIA